MYFRIASIKVGTSLFFCLLLLFSFPNFNAQAQTDLVVDSLAKKKEIFFGIGPMAYRGDLNSSFSKWSLGFSLGLKFNRFKKVNGNLIFTTGTINGQDIDYSFDDGNLPAPTPNRFFRTRVTSFHYELHYNFLNRKKLKAYAALGIGLMRFDPQDEFNESYIDQLTTRADNETYGNVALMLPTQIGAMYTLPNDFSVAFQLGFSNTASDYLDNISNWGTRNGNDNILSYKFLVHIPASF